MTNRRSFLMAAGVAPVGLFLVQAQGQGRVTALSPLWQDTVNDLTALVAEFRQTGLTPELLRGQTAAVRTMIRLTRLDRLDERIKDAGKGRSVTHIAEETLKASEVHRKGAPTLFGNLGLTPPTPQVLTLADVEVHVARFQREGVIPTWEQLIVAIQGLRDKIRPQQRIGFLQSPQCRDAQDAEWAAELAAGWICAFAPFVPTLGPACAAAIATWIFASINMRAACAELY